MKVLLVNPWIHDFAAYDFWLKPIGLLYVARAMEWMGYEVHLVDLLNRHDPDLPRFARVPKDKRYGTGKFPSQVIEKPEMLKSVPRRYKRYGAPPEFLEWKLREIGNVDLIMVTSTLSYWYPGVWETIRFLKSRYDVPIVLGGVYPRLFPEHAKKSGAIVYEKGDLVFLPSFLESLGFPSKEIPADWFEVFDPMYELYNRVGYLVFITTLGCPFRCSYCAVHRLWNGLRVRTPERVVETIEKYLNIFKVEDVVFFDDAILASGRFKDLLKLIVEKRWPVRFHLPNGIHARLLDEETAFLLKEANFRTIKLGYETSGRLQRETGGKVYDEDLVRAARILRKAGFTEKEVSAYIMVNMPGQTKEDVLNAIKVCLSEGIGISINEYTPIPGTKDWEKLVEEGKLDPDIDPVLLNNTVLPFWWKYGMSYEEIQEIKNFAQKLKKSEVYREFP
ncbi:Radical SAM domain protein [Thermotoga petrophila RKU-1]|uniref:Radical SAM domain protein n=1 Tax=Thermotoga petrophila (strain ATCC BAA-488 / DSM 13995 / JCM 10881 / RKU-1) TaxID=390874 RepID=A5IIP9_THEP1|nr:radical SAM protein [Thermotoga petrophila]ABQ46072.1 Radical SAM domain protein [Thermotoga petrophila RKU-1]